MAHTGDCELTFIALKINLHRPHYHSHQHRQIGDENCRFPGCTHQYYIDGHHIKHWADGGETSLDNLVLLCRHHHRLVHEGGFTCTKNSQAKIEFRNPQGILIARAGRMPVLPLNFDLGERMRNRYQDLFIDANTCVSKYDDARIDWDLAVGHMFH